jgi:hypothetical protein
MATTNAPTKLKQMKTPAKAAQLRVTRRSPAYWRVTIDNPPINVMGPEMVKQFQEVINSLETDERVPPACRRGRTFSCVLPACQSPRLP